MFITIITSLSLLLAWGASFAAESSNPWDILYPIKVNVNESVQSALAFWSESEAELQLSFIEERIEEKNELESEGKLTVELASKIETNIQSHVDKFNQERAWVESETEATNNLDVRFSSLVSLFWDNLNIDTEVTVSSESETSSNDSSSETNSETKSEVEADAEWSIDVDWIVDAMFDSSTQVQSESEAEINSMVNTAVEVQSEVEADIETSLDTLIDTVDTISIDSDTSASNSSNTTTSSSNEWVESSIESTTSIDSSNAVNVWDASITTDSTTDVTGNAWFGLE